MDCRPCSCRGPFDVLGAGQVSFKANADNRHVLRPSNPTHLLSGVCVMMSFIATVCLVGALLLHLSSLCRLSIEPFGQLG